MYWSNIYENIAGPRSVLLVVQRVDILLCLVDDDHGAVNRTVSVIAPLEFFIVLSIQFVTPTLFWSSTFINSWEDRVDRKFNDSMLYCIFIQSLSQKEPVNKD